MPTCAFITVRSATAPVRPRAHRLRDGKRNAQELKYPDTPSASTTTSDTTPGACTPGPASQGEGSPSSMSSRCSLARRTALTLKGALRWRVSVPLRSRVPAHGRGGAHASTWLALWLHSGGTEDREPSGPFLLCSCAWKVSGLRGPSTAYAFFQFI